MLKVSIIIPLYNLENYIGECVQSALDQTYQDIEIIVVNDGSTDDSLTVLKKFSDRIKIINQENRGAANALNAGIHASTGTYVSWMGADDVFMPMKTEEQIAFMEDNKEISLSYTDFYVIDSKSNIVRKDESPYYRNKKYFLYNLIKGNFINGASVMFKSSCLEKTGFFDETMGYHADGNMWFRMLKNFNFGHVPKPLLKYRWHESNLSHHTKNMKNYLVVHYEKVLDLYSVDELIPSEACHGNIYFHFAKIILEHQGLWNFSFSQLIKGFRCRPWRVGFTKDFASFVSIIPKRLLMNWKEQLFI